MFKNKDYSLIQIGSLKNSQDVVYYLFIFLFLPVLSIMLFSIPIYFILRLRNAIVFFLLISLVLIAEYFVYTYFASQADRMNGIYNGIVSLLLLGIFFYKYIEKQTGLLTTLSKGK